MRQVQGVSLTPDAIVIVYMDDATDVRGEGLIFQTHTMTIARHEPELDEEMDDLETAVSALLAAGIRRWSSTMPITPEDIAARIEDLSTFDDDDEEGDDDRG